MWFCDWCGFAWPRSKLRIDAGGLYTCPQEGKGRDSLTLTQLNEARTPISAEGYDEGNE